MFIIAGAKVIVASGKPSRLPAHWVDTPDHARTRDLLRRWYIAMINEVVPAVLDDLACDPFTQFQNAASAGIALDAWLGDDLVLIIDDVTRVAEVVGSSYWKRKELDDPRVLLSLPEPKVQVFRNSLHAWARRWNLPWETWCIGQAVYCLGEWLRSGSGDLGQRQWDCLNGGVAGDPRDLVIVPGDAVIRRIALRQAENIIGDEAPPFSLMAPGSDTRLEPPTQTEARLRKLFESQLRDYLDSRDRPLPTPPLVSPLEVREPEKHLTWLVRYNVLKESFGEIAGKTGRARSTVSEAIKGISGLAGIVLREPDPPGRPSGQKRSDSS